MKKEKEKFIVVGIGASAGGLEAINEFFDHISPNTGMAFIVIQHLSPDFKSLMDELLAKHTKMPINVVREKTPVEPNHIYLISKDSNLVLKDGFIMPVVRQNRHIINLPIDEFFHSLGESHQERAIGIILSGTGTDGSRGISTIKEAGGLVFVQTPESAQFDGMPRTALDTGLADNVLPPYAIAQTLINLVKSKQSGYLMFLNPENEQVQDIFLAILADVKHRVGVDFDEYRRTTLYRRIEKRMFLTHHDTIAAYAVYLKDNAVEIDNLYKEFLIGVTRFFRDTEAFDLLSTEVIAPLLRKKSPKEPIRIWIPSCSTGEEVYSVAILIQEYLTQHSLNRNYKIFASDLDAHAISIAGSGVYKKNIINDVGINYASKYFSENINGELVISKNIRDKIVFTVHDALNDPPFINLDLISCRNFMIYLKVEIQQRLLTSFQFALNFKGYLFLGPSESLGGVKVAFQPINERWNIFQNISSTKLRPSSVRTKERHGLKVSKALPQVREKIHRSFTSFTSSEDMYSNWLLRHFAPICLFVDEELDVLYINGDAESLLSFPKGPSNFNLVNMLEEDELLVFKNGIRKTIENQKNNIYKGITFKKRDKAYKVNLKFQPTKVKQLEGPSILIEIDIVREGIANEGKHDLVVADESTYQKERLRTLELELRQIKSEKQILVERLETTNEELQSSNEELLAANEELQSTNEELQSVNEELYTVNSELQGKVGELTIANNDMDNLLKATGIGTIFIDGNLNIRKFTPAVKEQFKLMASDIGRPITSFVNSFSKEKIYEDFKQVLKNSKKIEREVTDENGKSYLMRLLPYRLDKDKTDGVVASFVDLSDLKKATEEARHLAQLFQAIFHHAETHIAVLNEKYEVADINYLPPGFNLTKKEVIGKNIIDILPEMSHSYVENAFKDLAGKASINYSVPVAFDDKDIRWFQNTLISLNKEGTSKNYLLISRDETKLKNVEQTIRLHANIYEGVFRFAKEHFIILDLDGSVKEINYTANGYNKKDLIGNNFIDLNPPEYQEMVKAGFEDIVNKKQELFEYEITTEAPDGLEHHYSSIMFPIFLDVEIQRVIIITRDVSDLRDSEDELKKAKITLEDQLIAGSKELILKNQELEEVNTYLDSFVHGAAHDLRSPLTQMKGYLTLLPDIDDVDDRTSATKELLDSAVRMERILNGLIELIDFKKNTEPVVKTFNLANIYQETIDDLQPYIYKADANFSVDIPDELTINYIGAYLNSIFFNLIHNAIKYRSYTRKLNVKVSVKEEGEFIVFTISDNGIGMDLNKYGHFLFKPFKRLTVEREGTGIGLSIINNSVRRNGGRIEVKSYLNKGTTFAVYLKSYELN